MRGANWRSTRKRGSVGRSPPIVAALVHLETLASAPLGWIVPYVGGSLRRPRFGYRAQGRRPITSLATAVGVTSSPSILALSLILPSLRPFASHRQKSFDSQLSTRTRRFPFPVSYFNLSSFETFDFYRSILILLLFILQSCLSGFAKIESNRAGADRFQLRVAVKDRSRDRSGFRGRASGI